jgi:ferritin-like metal-binding protein YciE
MATKTKSKKSSTKRSSSSKRTTTAKKTQKKDMTLHNLLIQKMQALYDAENQIVKALPKMAQNASDDELRDAFELHLEQTKEQVTRLEQAFKALDEKPKTLSGDAIKGMIKDAEWLMKSVKNPEALDAGLISAAQYVEHYEIAGYGSAIEWAREMGHDEVVDLLEKTLAEEKETDVKLSELATSKINEAANDMKEEGTTKDRVEEAIGWS